jgi:type I restriction enzyme S subunit
MVIDLWKTAELGQVATLQRGYDLPYQYRKPGTVPIVTSSGINDTHDEARVVGPGVVTGRYGTIGEVFFVREDFWPLNTTLFVKDFHDNDPLFVSYLLRTIDFHSHSGKSGVPGVNRNDLHSLTVTVPKSVDEQRTIAAALSDVDALLAKLDQLIAKKRDIKQAAMQQLLTGKKRLPGFSGEWEVKRLGEIGTFSKGKGIRRDQVVSDGLPCIRYGEIYTHHNDHVRQFNSFIPLEVAQQSQRIQKGDLLFAGSGETAEEIGKCVAFLGDDAAYAGGDIVIFSPAGQNSMFLGYLMNHSTIVSQKARMGQGDAVVHLSARNLAQIEVHLPTLQEQTAIAAVLSDMDAEIAALEARRDKTRDLKQGMMQELLTGRTRLV